MQSRYCPCVPKEEGGSNTFSLPDPVSGDEAMKQNATPHDHRGFGNDHRPAFETRGVMLVPEDLTLKDWPERAHRAGLTTIALHHGSSPKAVACAVQSDEGQRFLERCRQLGLQVEYELHAMKELLPRDLFPKEP